MLRNFLWSWWRRLFFRKPTPLTGGRRTAQQPRRLGLEYLEGRVVPAVAAPTQALLSTSYQALLGRDVDSAGLNYWAAQLTAGASNTAVVSGILNSNEFLTDQVQNLYQTFLRRSGSSGEVGYWVAQKQAGATWDGIEATILGSAEYYAKSGGTLNSYVNQLFTDVLHRPVAVNELSYFQQQSAAPPAALALSVLTSPESANLQVTNDYRTVLSRAADATGGPFWAGQLEGGVDPTALLAGFLGSAEFAAQLNTFLTQTGATNLTSIGAAFLGASGKLGITGAALSEQASSSNLANVGLMFVPNVGQTGGQAQYVAQGAGYTAFLTPTGPVLSLNTYTKTSGPIVAAESAPPIPSGPSGPTGEVSLGMLLVGGNANATPVAEDQLASRTNYFIGPQSDWQTNVANYGAVDYQNVYGGIDAIYRGAGQNLRYDFVIHPGATASEIALSFPGWQASVAADGSLVLYQPQAKVTLYEAAPKLYQGSTPIYGGFVSLGGGAIGYQVGAYDHNQALTIDPTLVYSTFVGGTGNDAQGSSPLIPTDPGMAVDGSGNTYLATSSTSTDFPVVPGSFNTIAPNKTESTVVFKLNSSGSGLVYSTYLGNNSMGTGAAIAIDASGDAYVGSEADNDPATPYPTTPGAFKRMSAGNNTVNIVVTELNPNGNALVYSTFIAGSTITADNNADLVTAITVDAAGNAYFTGNVVNSSLPATAGVFQDNTTPAVKIDPDSQNYVVKLAAGGSSLDYATYLTGSKNTNGYAIVLDASGDAYVSGDTFAKDFPTTAGAYQTMMQGANSNFVSELKPDASGLIFSTFLNGSTGPSGSTSNLYGIARDSAGDIYGVGFTETSDFPTTPGAYDTTYGGGFADAVVVKFNSTGSNLLASTYLGTMGDDRGFAISLDPSGNVFVGGYTDSATFPNVNPIQPPENSVTSKDGFVSEFDSGLTTLKFSTNIGGLGDDAVQSVVADNSGNVYVAGWSKSTSGNTGTNDFFTTTPGAFQTSNAGGVDAFVLKLNIGALVPPPPPPPGGGGTQVIVSTTDIYPENNTSDTATELGSLGTVTIFSYQNLQLGVTPTGLPEYQWYKWEASAAGTFYATLTTTSGSPLEMHLFEVNNGILTELSSTPGGTLSTPLSQGESIYVEVKGQNTAPGVKTEGEYNLDVALEP